MVKGRERGEGERLCVLCIDVFPLPPGRGLQDLLPGSGGGFTAWSGGLVDAMGLCVFFVCV